MAFETGTPPGRTWIFEQTALTGGGYWYDVGAGRIDEEGRGIGNIPKVSFRSFTGDILICPAGVVPPGRRSPPSFPILRYGDKIEGEGDAALGLTWGFRHVHPKSGKGYPDTIGIGWFDEQGRARGRFLLRLVSGFKGLVIVCPPGIKPPPGPLPPIVVPRQPLEMEAEGGGEDEAEFDG
jgi:hypothetical protein